MTRPLRLVVLLFSLFGIVLPAADLTPDAAEIRKHADALLAIDDRRAGSQGGEAAADYLAAQLRAVGYDEVFETTTTVTVPVEVPDAEGRLSHLHVNGNDLRIHPHHSNFNSVSSTGGETLMGTIVYAGSGSGQELKGKAIQGNFVVLNSDSDTAWLTCAQLGAKAVLFIHPERLDAGQLRKQFLANASLDFPRFVLPQWQAALDGQQASLWSMVRLQPRKARSLTVQALGTSNADDGRAVMLTAGYEAGGNILGLDPAAHRAWNAALLLELARQFKHSPPKRDTLITFHGGRVEAFRGLRDLLGSLSDLKNLKGDVTLQRKLKWNNAPLGNAEAVAIAKNLWRSDLVEADFRAFLANPDQSEQILKDLLTDLDYLPEDKAYYDDLGYLTSKSEKADGGMEAGSEADTSSTDSDALSWGSILGVVFAALCIVGLVILNRKVAGFSRIAMIASSIPFILLMIKLLQPPASFTGTDTESEGQEVLDLGHDFIREAAARRADILAPNLENLRLYRSLLKTWKKEALAKRSTNEDYQRRWRRDSMTIRSCREFLLAAGLSQVDVDYDIERADPAHLEAIDKLTYEIESEHRRWRNVQQKLGNAELSEDEIARLPGLITAIIGTATDRSEDSMLARHRAALSGRLANLRSGIDAREGLASHDVALILGVDLSDGHSRFSSHSKGWLVNWPDQRLHKKFRDLAQEINDRDMKGALAYEWAPYQLGDEHAAWYPKSYAHVAGFAGIFSRAATLATVCDERLKLGTPLDSAANFQDETFLAQTQGLTVLLRRIIGDEDMTTGSLAKRPTFVVGPAKILTRSEGSVDGKKGYPFPHFTLYFGDAEQTNASFNLFWRDVQFYQTAWGDAFGELRIPWVPQKLKDFGSVGKKKFSATVCGFDPQGRIQDIMVTDGVHKAKGVQNDSFEVGKAVRPLQMQVFECESSEIFSVFDPRLLKSLNKTHLLSAARDAKPNYLHIERSGSTVIAYSPPGVRLRLLAAEGDIGNRFLLLGDYDGGKSFDGLYPGDNLATEPIPDSDERERVPTALAVAQDILQLCKFRLENLQSNGINPEATWEQLAEAQKRLDEAKGALGEGDIDGAEAKAQASWSYLGNVYPTVLSTANDVVYGLVVMLLIAIPFALICERLLISGATIGRKVAGFTGFFSVVFLFFFFLHPAFSLATTPVIIFLAFTIILLSVMVIGLLYSRFEHEMQLIRMSGLGMHTADVNRLSTLLATGQLGISNMRRRPLRTFLTGLTVVLMTFILLTFSSFKPSAGTRALSLGVPPNFNGILVAKPGWTQFDEDAFKRIENTWGDRLDVHERRWLQSDDQRTFFPLVAGAQHSKLEGLVGSANGDPSGMDQALIRGALGETGAPRGFDPDNPGKWIFVAPDHLEELMLEAGGEVTLMGESFLIGTLDLSTYANISHLGGDPLAPLSMATMTEEQKEEIKQQQQLANSGESSGESVSFTHVGPEDLGILHRDAAKRLGAGLRSFSLVPYTPDQAAVLSETAGRRIYSSEEIDLGETAEDMAHQLALTLTVGDRGDSYLLTSVSGVAVSGLADVLIPLILGGLIIFSTMLGSVAERGKEIFIFSSLGLAPIHVGALFLVEASIYAVLGGLGGYIIAQLLVAVLGLLADMGIGVQPDLNYSSLTAVVTILLVMGTVLLSALYPAWVASRSAKPGEENDFTVPEPDGDNLSIPFPFTVAKRDIQGLLAFLKAYFDANTEASTGCFTAADASLQAIPEEHAYQVKAKSWLAPFDLGISQHFVMTANPTDVPAIYSVHIDLALLSGQRNAWRRVCLPFLRELRKQFLVWRTLDTETMDRYRAEGGDEAARKRIDELDAERLRERDEAAKHMGKHGQDEDGDQATDEGDSTEETAPADDMPPPTTKPTNDSASGEEQR